MLQKHENTKSADSRLISGSDKHFARSLPKNECQTCYAKTITSLSARAVGISIPYAFNPSIWNWVASYIFSSTSFFCSSRCYTSIQIRAVGTETCFSFFYDHQKFIHGLFYICACFKILANVPFAISSKIGKTITTTVVVYQFQNGRALSVIPDVPQTRSAKSIKPA